MSAYYVNNIVTLGHSESVPEYRYGEHLRVPRGEYILWSFRHSVDATQFRRDFPQFVVEGRVEGV